MQVPKEIIEQFCSNDEINMPINSDKPYVSADGKTVATDGKVILIVDEAIQEYKHNPRGPDYKRIMSMAMGSAEKKEVMFLPRAGGYIAGRSKCRTCGGKAYFKRCETCEGEGEHRCSCGDTHDCKACRGEGEISYKPKADEMHLATITKCEECDADGKETAYADGEIICDAAFSGKILHQLSLLPGSLRLTIFGPTATAFFHGEGFCGAFMPLSSGDPYAKK